MRALAMVVLLALSGCQAAPLAPADRPGLSKTARVSFPPGTSPERRERLRRVLDLAGRAYRYSFAGGLPYVRQVQFVRGRLLKRTRGGKLLGLANMLTRVIYLPTKHPWAILHEIHHLRVADADHTDPAFRRANRLGLALRWTADTDSKTGLK